MICRSWLNLIDWSAGLDLPGNAQGGSFPVTRHSIVMAAQSDDPAERLRAIEAVIAAYWKPIYKYVRMKWAVSKEDAQDFTQEFFTRLMEKEFLEAYDPSKGRLRTFLRICADRLYLNQRRDAQRLKRSGAAAHSRLDFDEAERELTKVAAGDSLEEYFEREWVRSLFSLALERFRAQCKSAGKAIHFALFERYDLAEELGPKPSYAELASEFGLASTDVTNYLAFARREFRRAVLDQLREMTASEEEFRREAHALLGVDPV
jgi:RNA polymerase sigma factor (sigma-70 family)